MSCLPKYCKAMTSVSLACMLLLSLTLVACTGPMGPPGAAATQPEAAIVLIPNIVEGTETSVDAYGSGFTPNTRVLVGLTGEFKGKAGSHMNLWLATTITNEYGAFSASLDLKRFLKRIKITPAVYTVVAKSEADEVATAPLRIMEKKK